MSILCKSCFGRLRQLRSADVEQIPGPRDSRRSCRVAFAIIRGLHKNLLDLSLMTRSRDVFFFL